MDQIFKKSFIIFLFGILLGFNLNSKLNFDSNFDEDSVSSIYLLRGGIQPPDPNNPNNPNNANNANSRNSRNSRNNKSVAFVTPPVTGSKVNKEQPPNSQNPDILPKWAMTKVPGKGGFPDNSGGGDDGNDGNDSNDSQGKNEQINENLKNKDANWWNQVQQKCQEAAQKGENYQPTKVISLISEDPALAKQAKKACKNQKIRRDLKAMREQIELGNENPGTGTKTLFKGIKEARSKSGARLYFRKRNGVIEILAKSSKTNQKDVIKILRKKYG